MKLECSSCHQSFSFPSGGSPPPRCPICKSIGTLLARRSTSPCMRCEFLFFTKMTACPKCGVERVTQRRDPDSMKIPQKKY